MTRTAPQTWTTRALLDWMTKAFDAKGIESSRLCAEMLLGHVIGCDRLRLYMEPDRPAAPLERESLRGLVGRALEHEPIQYLVGEAWFFGMSLNVDPRVLVPRQCTGTIVEHVLQHQRTTEGFGSHDDVAGTGLLIADVCTGSGAIAIALALGLPGARVVASDVSSDALDVARANVDRHEVGERVELVEGSLLEPLREHPVTRAKGSLHYLVANPPYIPDGEWADVPANVREHEPEIALRGGADGLELVRPLITEGAALVRSGGLMLVEVASSTTEEAVEIARAQDGVVAAEILEDLEGLPRVVVATME